MKVLVKRLDDDVEEEVDLVVDGKELTCFAGCCPYVIEEGGEYEVAFEMQIFDDYSVMPSEFNGRFFSRIGDGFGYLLNGKLIGKTIDCGLPFEFEDPILLSDFACLEGQFVQLKVDRIDVSFL